MNEGMYREFNEILLNYPGDIIDFRVYKGSTFSYLVKLANEHGRIAVGMDTFYGLESPTRKDYNHNNELPYPKGYAKATPDIVHSNVKRVCPHGEYELYEGPLVNTLEKLPERTYCIALIDLFHYTPTKVALDYIYDRMTPGGLLYFLNYHKDSGNLASLAIDEFIVAKGDEIFVHPDVNYHGNRVSIGKISCKQTTFGLDHDTSRVTNYSSESKPTVALVLKTGGDTYNYRYVNALARNIREKTTIPFNLAVLTDDPTGIDTSLVNEIIPLKHNFKGWWSKIELFRPDIFHGQVIYFDLDTVIVDNIDDILLYRTHFAGIRDLYHHTFMQSGVMSWDASSNTHLYTNFVPRALHAMTHFSLEGDAKWIRDNTPHYSYLSDIFPDRIVSFKAHCLCPHTGMVSIPPKSSIVCFHGKPRPHTIRSPEITKHWKYE